MGARHARARRARPRPAYLAVPPTPAPCLAPSSSPASPCWPAPAPSPARPPSAQTTRPTRSRSRSAPTPTRSRSGRPPSSTRLARSPPASRAPRGADLPDGFSRLSEAAPEIAQEIRYTTAFNFVGAPIDGYLAPECILTDEAAGALRRAAAELARRDLGLKVYDCYRPQQAVDHFIRWIRRPDDQAMKTAFYPDEPKNMLVRKGYISTRSGHSRGSTVDLTLVRLPASERVRTHFPVDSLAPRCDGPYAARLDEQDLDMGTAYDCLSPLAATASTVVSAEARANRRTLVGAMGRAGFRNYTKEWWHFTLRGEPHTGQYFDFPVE